MLHDKISFVTAWDVSQIFADLELQMLVNRKQVFDKAKATGKDSFRAEVYKQFNAYNEANSIAANNALAETLKLARAETERAVERGVSLVDKSLHNYERQGYKSDKRPQNTAVQMLTAMLVGAIGGYKSVTDYARQNAQKQMLAIANNVNPNADNLDKEIDRAQKIFSERGIAGSMDRTGKEKSMSAQAEFLAREQSQGAFNIAKGQRMAECGMSLILVSAHPSSCPLCLPWQGKVLIDDVTADGKADGKHELLSTAVSEGFSHFNCRHNWVPFVEGIDNPNLYDKEKATPKETAMRYAIEQEQRNNERHIRQHKRIAVMTQDPAAKALEENKIVMWQARQRALAKIAESNGMPFYRQYSREQVGGKTEPKVNIDAEKHNIRILTKVEKNAIISSRSTDRGKASAIKILGSDVNKRQQKVLDKLPEVGSTFVANKKVIKPKDVAALTAKEGVEFTIFTKGNQRMIVRGNEVQVPTLREKEFRKLAEEGWKWSAHSHITTGTGSTWASEGDMKVLECFKQKSSLIVNANGEFEIFFKEEK